VIATLAGDPVTVSAKVAVDVPLALVAVIVYVVALATDVGVPVNAPVEVLKLIPAGVALIAKLTIAPPFPVAVNPVAAVFAVRVSEAEERVNNGKREPKARIGRI
jgi:hypothetical protein